MGNKLLEDLALATGLPEGIVQKELVQLIEAAGMSEKDLDLDSLREILASYAQDVLLSAKLEHEQKASNS